MSQVSFTPSGPPQTVLDPAPAAVTAALSEALALGGDERRAALAALVAEHPRWSDGWAHLGLIARDTIEAYAYFRVGYHRGLDQLRQSGWRGSGYVRWQHEGNRGFLRCLAGLSAAAAAIGEHDEAERCALFVGQCDPSGVPADVLTLGS
jgi:hypothetical protein